MNKRLIDYIKKGKNKGFSSKKIKDALLEAGHDINTVNVHLNHVYKKMVNKKKMLIPLLIILIVALSVGFYYYFKPATLEVKTESKLEDYINLGWSLYNQDRFEEAIVQFNNAIALNPEIERPYRGLGWSYYNLADYDKAIENFEEAIGINPDNDNAYNGLGWSYHLLENYEKAIENFNHIQNVNGDYKILSLLGRIYLKSEDNEKAKEMFEKSLSVNDTYFLTYAGLGRYYARQNEYNLSLHYYKKSVELDPTDEVGYIGLSAVYYLQGNYEKAKEISLESFSKIKGGPKRCFIFIYLGLSEFNLGDVQAAKNYLEEGLNRDPDCQDAHLLQSKLSNI